MNLNISFDQSVSSLPSGLVSAVNFVVSYFDSLFTNNVTVNIDLGYGEVDGQAMSSGALGESATYYYTGYSYTQVVNALKTTGLSATQVAAYATLPASSPMNGTLDIATAEAKALGLTNYTGLDGYIGISNVYPFSDAVGQTPASNQYYLIGVLTHEVTEVMGRDSYLDDTPAAYGVMDLFRYSAAGVRQTGTGSPAYFSINGGSTDLGDWNTNPSGDFGDWASDMSPDSFLAFSNSGVINGMTTTDLELMNILGWNNTGPLVTTGNMTVAPNSSTAAGNLVYVQIPASEPITEIQFFQSSGSSGQFFVNGVAQPNGQILDLTRAQFFETTFQSGTTSDSVSVRVFDGAAWSPWDTFTVSAAYAGPPVVTTGNMTVGADSLTPAGNLVYVTDPSNLTMTEFQLTDNTGGGHFVVDGVVQPTGQAITLTRSQFFETYYQAGLNTSDSITVQVFDGVSWSAPDTFTVSAPYSPPVVTTGNMTVAPDSTNPAGNLVYVQDAANLTMTEFQLTDNTGGGHFVVDGVAQPTGQTITLTRAQFFETYYQAGVNTSDSITVQVFDGVSWSAPDTFTVSAPYSPPVVTTGNTTVTSDSLTPAGNLVYVQDAANLTMTEFQFIDSTGGGQFVVNGVAQPTGQVIDLTRAQFFETYYQSGASTSDSISVRVFDGIGWSAWDTFTVTAQSSHSGTVVLDSIDSLLPANPAPPQNPINAVETGVGSYANVNAPVVAAGGTLELPGAETAGVTFLGSTGSLKLDAPQSFTGSISGFTGDGTLAGSDQIDLVNFAYNSLIQSGATYDPATGILTLSNGTATDTLQFNGSYVLANFKFADDGNGGTIVYDPPVPGHGTWAGAGSGTVQHAVGMSAEQDSFVFAPNFAQGTAPLPGHQTDFSHSGQPVDAHMDAAPAPLHDDAHVITDAAHDTTAAWHQGGFHFV